MAAKGVQYLLSLRGLILQPTQLTVCIQNLGAVGLGHSLGRMDAGTQGSCMGLDIGIGFRTK